MTRINTSKGLAYALSFGQGMKNSIMQLVEFNQIKLDQLKLLFDKKIVQCGENYHRANHTKFERSSNSKWCNQGNEDFFQQIKGCEFHFELYAYSNIKPSVKISC